MTRYTISRKQQKQIKEFKAKATKDLVYFLFCGLIFTGLIKTVTPVVEAATVSITSFISSPFTQTTKASAMSIPLLSSVEPTPIPQAETWHDFIKSAEEIAPIYSYPVQLLLSQAAHESNRGLSHYAQERNNYFGMGCYDWNPDLHCIWYENEKQSIISYILNIRDTFPEAWASRENPEEMLRLLQSNNSGVQYASDPEYVSKVINTPEWRSY